MSQQSGDGEGVNDADQEQVPLPTPKIRENESFETKKARLLYQSRKRGMLENGLLLG